MMYSALQLCLAAALAGQAIALPRSGSNAALTARDNCPAFDFLLSSPFNCNSVSGQECYYCCDDSVASSIDGETEEDPLADCHAHDEPGCGETQTAVHCAEHDH